MNNLEKLITNLSNYWDISPDKVVDRLNFMNEQEINKIVDKMTKKFKNGGLIDCLRNGGEFSKCMKCGGNMVRKGATGLETDSVPKDFTIEVSSPGDTLMTKNYNSGPVTRRTVPGKGEWYTRTQGYSGIKHYYSPGFKFGVGDYIKKIILGAKPIPESESNNWKELISNHKNDPITVDKTKKATGGELKQKMSTPPKKKQNLLKTKK